MALTINRLLQIADEEGVPRAEALAIFYRESDLGDNTVSKESVEAKVTGPFQLKAETFKEVADVGADINDFEANARAGLRYFKKRKEAVGGNLELGARGYYGGPNPSMWGTKTTSYGSTIVEDVGKIEKILAEEEIPTKERLRGSLREKLPVQAALRMSGTEETEEGVGGPITLDKKAFISKAIGQQQVLSSQIAVEGKVQEQSFAELVKQYNDAASALFASQGKMGIEEANMYAAQAARESARGAQASKITSSLGVNTDDVDQLWAKTAIRIVETGEKLSGLRSQIVAQQAKVPQFLDNPLGYIIGHMAMKGDINLHNNLLGQYQQDVALQSQRTKIASELDAVNAPKLATLDAAKSLAHSNLALATSKANQSKVMMDAVLVNQAFASKKMENLMRQEQQIDRNIRIYSLLQENESQEIARQARIDLAAEKKEADRNRLDQINHIAAMVGRQPFTSTTEFDKQPTKIKLAFEQIKNSGGNVLGEDTFDALKNVSLAGDPRNMPDSSKVIFSYVNAWKDKAFTEIQKDEKLSGQFMIANEKEKRVLLNNYVQKKFGEMQDTPNVNPIEGKVNPYKSPSIDVMMQNASFAKTNLHTLLTDLTKSMKSQGQNVEITDGMIINLVQQKLLSGDYPGGIEQAAKDLQTYFLAARNINNSTYNFEAWHLPPQRGYLIQGKNFTDYATVVSELLKQQSMGLSRVLDIQRPITPRPSSVGGSEMSGVAAP